MSTRLTIARLGAQGDGVADTERGPVFVPFALPGEEVVATVERDRGALISVTKPSPLRVEPPAGISAPAAAAPSSISSAGAYRAWKRDIVVGALASRGIDGAGRRARRLRAADAAAGGVLGAADRAGMLLGYNRRCPREIVAIEECPILLPEIVAALDRMRELAALIAATPRAFRIAVTATASGLDIAASEQRHAVRESAPRGRRISSIAQGFARLSVDGEIVVEPQAADRDVRRHCRRPAARRLPAGDRGRRSDHGRAGRRASRARRSGSPTCSPAAARSRCGWRGGAEVHAVEGDAAALAAFDRGVPACRRAEAGDGANAATCSAGR